MSDFFEGLIRGIAGDICYAGTSEEVMMASMNLHLLFLPCIGFVFSYHDELEEKAWQNKSMETHFDAR